MISNVIYIAKSELFPAYLHSVSSFLSLVSFIYRTMLLHVAFFFHIEDFMILCAENQFDIHVFL